MKDDVLRRGVKINVNRIAFLQACIAQQLLTQSYSARLLELFSLEQYFHWGSNRLDSVQIPLLNGILTGRLPGLGLTRQTHFFRTRKSLGSNY